MNQELIESCQKAILLLENPPEDVQNFSKKMVVHLSVILKCTVEMDPKISNFEVERIKVDSSKVHLNMLKLFNGEKLYKQVFDPIEDDEFVTFSLSNDLCEIYEELSVFLSKTKFNSDLAEWDFKEEFRSHLSQHFLNSIKVLYLEYCKYE